MNQDGKLKKTVHSIQFQVTAAIFLLIAGVVFLTVMFNALFLERYYLSRKKQAMWQVQETLDSLFDRSETSGGKESLDNMLVEVTRREGVDLIVLDTESRAVRIYGSDRETIQQRLFENLFSPDDSSVNKEILDEKEGMTLQIVTAQGRRDLELWGILKNGELFLLRSPVESIRNSTAIANRFFTLIGLLCAAFSALAAYFIAGRMTAPVRELSRISERMKDLDFDARFTGRPDNEIGILGENINELSASLEHSIADLKTANLKLQADIRQKEEIEHMRQEFISGLTHEFKTPLALIRGYAEGLIDGVGSDPESQRAYCEVIVDETKRMNDMVQRFLTLNHLEFGKTELSMERFDICSMIRDLLETSRPLIEKQRTEVRFEESSPCYVWSDPYLTEEVFTNYLTNALHHVSADGYIGVFLDRHERSIRINVFNTGEKIPKESLPHIWDQFYKVDKARTRAYGGSGVGLSIVRAMMNLLERSYGVRNEENGVTFWFELENAGSTDSRVSSGSPEIPEGEE